jgi:hypothetical protein
MLDQDGFLYLIVTGHKLTVQSHSVYLYLTEVNYTGSVSIQSYVNMLIT